MALYDDLPAKEDKFHNERVDTYAKKLNFASSETMPGAFRVSHPNNNWYTKEVFKKDKIVLHFTAGQLNADIGELTKNSVSVAYVVARNGKIYELFDPKYWAYHLGPAAVGGNTPMCRSSIAIEISNIGPLTLDKENGILKTWSGKPYCTLEQEAAYVHDPKGYRGLFYFATFTDAQYDAVNMLLDKLCEDFKIPRTLPEGEARLAHLSAAPPPGVWSHQNFRLDKSDLGLAFDWAKIGG